MQLTLLVAAPAVPPLAVIAVRPQPAAFALAAAAAVLIAVVVAARLRALAGARVERERGRAERRAHALAAQSTEVVAVIGGDGTIVEVGPSAERLWGYPSGVLRGKAAEGLIHPEEAARFRGYLGEVAAGTVGGFLHLRIRRADGTYGQVEVVAADRRQDPEIAGLVVVCRMSGEGTTVESQLVHHAFHDPLTELPNRALFADRLEHALARRERREGVVAVVVLDLDDFRSVNQGLGHAAGDELLVAVGQRISSCLREGDTAARLGGDEFALLLDTVSDAFGLSAVAERIREVLQLPLTIGEEAVAVSASMGMALAEPDTTAPRWWRRRAARWSSPSPTARAGPSCSWRYGLTARSRGWS
jgi:diguanylate cyclase (GGDEF)-like protein/PAS domain S-box-containing protein